MFVLSSNEDYKQTDDYETWLSLIKVQDKKDKRAMSKIRSSRIS